jgi:AraC-like DNA-binding protein
MADPRAHCAAPSTPPAGDAATLHSIGDFRRAVNESFVPLNISGTVRGSFGASLRTHSADGVTFTEVRSDPHLVERTPETILRGVGDYYKFSLMTSGSAVLVQDGREVVLRPGDMTFYDTSRPYSLLFEEQFQVLVVMLPKDRLGIPSRLVDSLTAVSLGDAHPLAGTITPFLTQITGQFPLIPALERIRLTHASLDLFQVLISSILGAEAAAQDPRQQLFLRITDYIDAQLGSPELSPGSIAAAHFISTRHLHSLFHDAGTTVSAWIREQRLARCRTEILQTANTGRSIASIAAEWGFPDAAHFSRAFRSVYGAAPSSLRSTAAAPSASALTLRAPSAAPERVAHSHG